MLPLRARVDLGAMAMKGYSASPKLQHCWNLTIRLFSVICRTLVSGGSYPSAEKQSVYSTAPTDWARRFFFVLHRGTCLYFLFLLFPFYGPPKRQNPLYKIFFWGRGDVGLLSPCLVISPLLSDSFASQNSREFDASHFLGQILVCANTVW